MNLTHISRLRTGALALSLMATLGASFGQTRLAKPPLFVLNSQDATISVVDPETWTERKRIPTGKEPHHMYLTPDQKSLIVANAAADSLTFVDPVSAEVQYTVRDILDPYHLRFSPDMKWLVIAGNRLNHVDIYQWNGSSLLLSKRITTGKTPSHLWIDTKSTTIYATMQESDELIAIDMASQTIKWRKKTGALPADVFGTPDDQKLLVALTGGAGVEVYDVSGTEPRLLQLLKTGLGAHAFRALGDQRHVFVSNRVANSISKIDYADMKVVSTFNAPNGPDCMEITSDGKTLFVASRWAAKLTQIDLASGKVERQLKVGKSPHGVWTIHHAGRL